MDAHTVRLLKQLRNELQQAESLTETDIELREQLLEDIEALLQGSTVSSSDYHPAIDRLQEAVRRFEVTHPALAEGLGRVINSLTNIGI
jgi:hypothetical protein